MIIDRARAWGGVLTPTLVGNQRTRVLVGLQLPLTLLLLALVPGGWAKLVGFLLCWALTFSAITRQDLVIYVVVSALFSLMDIMAVQQGVFRFNSPDYLGLPVWEFFMWGFYVLHCLRFLGGPAPRTSRLAAAALAVLFAVPFVTLSDPWLLLVASGTALTVALSFYHDRQDLAYLGYMVVLGALVEYCGVWSGQWHYPGDPVGGVPLWFATMWGGIGLFTRRLILPFVRTGPSPLGGPA